MFLGRRFGNETLESKAAVPARLARFAATRGKIDAFTRQIERLFESENRRIQALVLAEDPGADRQEIKGHFNDALQLARSQKAKALELRAALSLARFVSERDVRDRALALLSPIYETFTEGFDTPDLGDAKALLEQLS